MTVPMLDELIQLVRDARRREVVIGMAHRGRLNVLAHNLGRPYESIFAEFEGAIDARADHHDPAGRHRRRQVPPRRPGRLPAPERRVDHRPARSPTRATSRSSPRSSPAPRARRRPTRQGPHAHHDTNAAIPVHPPRRRRLPGPGRRRRDAEPAGARRLHGRRHDPHHPEQPGRLHHRPRRRAARRTWASRPGQGLRRPDHPRQRRRRRRPASPPSGSRSRSARSSATTC